MTTDSRNLGHRRLDEALRRLHGEQLSSVEFVQDYVQLRFDGPCLSVYTAAEVEYGEESRRRGTPGYCDALCQRIGRLVVSTEIKEGEAVLLRLDDGSTVKISLRDEDYRGPEALEFKDDSEWWVV